VDLDFLSFDERAAAVQEPGWKDNFVAKLMQTYNIPHEYASAWAERTYRLAVCRQVSMNDGPSIVRTLAMAHGYQLKDGQDEGIDAYIDKHYPSDQYEEAALVEVKKIGTRYYQP